MLCIRGSGVWLVMAQSSVAGFPQSLLPWPLYFVAAQQARRAGSREQHHVEWAVLCHVNKMHGCLNSAVPSFRDSVRMARICFAGTGIAGMIVQVTLL